MCQASLLKKFTQAINRLASALTLIAPSNFSDCTPVTFVVGPVGVFAPHLGMHRAPSWPMRPFWWLSAIGPVLAYACRMAAAIDKSGMGIGWVQLTRDCRQTGDYRF